MGNYRC